MPDVLALLQCLAPLLPATTLGQFSLIVVAVLAMTGRVTMLGISRWTEQGGSYRTVQRFFNSALDWGQLHWTLVKTHLLHPQDTYILAGDEVVVTKAGDETHGLNRFFSSLFGKTVPGVAFFAFALVNVPPRTAHPLRMGQVLRPEPPATEVAPAPAPPAEKRGPGRPKGSKNRNKADVELSPHLCFIQTLLRAVLTAIGTTLVLSYVVLDGAFGNNYALQMVRRCQLHLISKLAVNSALYFLYDGPYSGHGPYTKYGARVKYGQLPAKYLKRTSTEKGIRTDIYQFQALHKLFAQTLNIVIIVKTNTQTGAWAHAILFSSELTQTYDQMIDYYTLRFQIEIVFTQMTKGRLFAGGRGRDNVADFHLVIIDDDAVDQQLYQLSALGEIELLECRLQAATEIFDASGELGGIQLLLGLRLQLPQLLRQAALGLGEFLALALELVAPDHLGQVNFEQAGLLALQVRQRGPQGPLPILQSLRQPLARLSTHQFVSDQGRLSEQVAQVLPD
jgi:hypothetical protein